MIDIKKEEENIVELWKKEKISEKVRERNRNSKKKYYFMDGPPYATGHIHMGTALNKVLKDIAIRMKRMQGFDVFDRPGYDTHGVPIEFQIEKEIGSRGREDIEKYGVKKFIEKCKEYATKYIDVMNSEFENLGVWMDWKNPYLTLSDEYIEAIWWTFKKADEKKLLYLGKYPVHVCPRCETAVAYNEIIYTKQEDNSIYVKFPLKEKNKFLIIWTTTPWTLPGNTAVMVHPDFTYAEIELSSGERWILAKELVSKIMTQLGIGYTMKKEFKGKELEGLEYVNPLSKNLKVKTKNAYKVILSGRYVNLEDGTGLVHSAPGHGKEDYDASKPYGIDILSPVNMNGTLTEETGKYFGKKARIVDNEIIKDLEEDKKLVYQHKYTHDYPICWRCKSPLLMISVPQWFFKISSIHKKLLSENEKTDWIPSWMKARMNAWLEGVGDWPISRQRYWGTPLPIWTCECGEKVVVGSINELKKLSKKEKISLHKPEIDEISFPCKKCKGKMKRVKEVLDVWFDSGVSSWAALDFPQDDKKFKEFWPADLNIEATEQTRGWWNSQLILSMIAFDKKPYKSIAVHGMVLDIGKKKMSKSLGNIISPSDIISKYGRDYLRLYLVGESKGEDFAFDENALKELGRFYTILFNIHNLISLYAGLECKENVKPKKIEDKWIVSKVNSLTKEVLDNYNKYLFFKSAELIQKFVSEDFSRRYIQFVRERIDEKDKDVKDVLNYILFSVIRLLAPINPYVSEILYKNMKGKEKSIHLYEFPEQRETDKKLEDEFEVLREILEKGMAERDKAQIGLKWPLANAEIEISKDKKISKELYELIEKQLNVKKVSINQGKEIKVKLDIKITPELEAEGYAREITRKVQAARKDAGLVKEDKIELVIVISQDLARKISSQREFIKERTNSRKVSVNEKFDEKKFKDKKEDRIKEESINIFFNKL